MNIPLNVMLLGKAVIFMINKAGAVRGDFNIYVEFAYTCDALIR